MENDLVLRAREFAEEKHKGQVRRSGEDYVLHSVRVAGIVGEYYDGDDVWELRVVALLHDVLENCDVSFGELVEEFGEDVAGKVLELTTDKGDYGEGGKVEYLSLKLADVSRVGDLALVVKLADRLDNVSDLGERGSEFRERVRGQTVEILDFVERGRELLEVHERLVVAIRGRLGWVKFK